jgi:hypothetical protein
MPTHGTGFGLTTASPPVCGLKRLTIIVEDGGLKLGIMDIII